MIRKISAHYVEPPAGSTSKAAFAHILRQGNTGLGIAGGLTIASRNTVSLKTTRAFGRG
jgi:hypothetical protein